jgi:hypothetical protein
MVPIDGTAHLAAALPLPRGMLTNINHHRGSVRMVGNTSTTANSRIRFDANAIIYG